MRDDECFSILELLELKTSGIDEASGAFRHLKGCLRCSALLRSIPHLTVPEAGSQIPQLRVKPLPDVVADGIHSGQLWIARGSDELGRAHVVVVVGTRRDIEGAVVVVPTTTNLEDATDLDLYLEATDSTLEYPFIAAVWNFGTVMNEQLERCIGAVSDDSTKRLLGLYRYVVTGSVEPVRKGVGSPVVGTNDPRLISRAAHLEEWKSLFAPMRRLLSGKEDLASEGPPSLSPTLADVVRSYFEEGEWDEASLIESAHVPAPHLNALLKNRLDLTDQGDANSVAAVLFQLGLDEAAIEESLIRSLELSPGGLRIGTPGTDRVAARSFAEVSEERRAEEIRERLSTIDESAQGREQAIRSYVDTVLQRLDELS